MLVCFCRNKYEKLDAQENAYPLAFELTEDCAIDCVKRR